MHMKGNTFVNILKEIYLINISKTLTLYPINAKTVVCLVVSLKE